MNSPQPLFDPEQRENLIAYLDGELDEAETRRIEETLARDARARREVELLTRTWELLDELPRPSASPDFVRKTLTHATLGEAVTVPSANGSGSGLGWKQALSRNARAVLAAGGIALAAAAGFALTYTPESPASKALLDDLPVIENLSLYREVGDVAFLKELQASGLFNESASPEQP